MRLCVVGCGHVGLVTGSCLSAIGHQVVCVDRDLECIHLLERGVLPIYEPYLAELIERGCASGLLRFTSDTRDALLNSDVVFLCVGVPQFDNGESDFAALDGAAREIALAADSPKLIVERSTVPVQTGEQLKRLLSVYAANRQVNLQVAANPQFLREGTAIEEFLHPDRVLLGVQTAESEATLRKVYDPILQQTFECPVHAQACPHQSPELVLTNVHSAELIKYVSNAFLAVKISYANILADLCERLGADVEEVTHAVGLDPRIGLAFLKAGIGFGGDRLPKDLRAFAKLLQAAGVDAGILKAADDVNRGRLDSFFDKLQRSVWVLPGKEIGLLGLAHKGETDDIRGSPAIEFCKKVTAAGARVRAYDPQAMQNARALYQNLSYCGDAYQVAEGAHALLILTDWAEFRLLDWARILRLMARPLLLDSRNLLSPSEMKSLGFEYHSIGRPD